jgi:ketosteroid isomerase-like protein
VSQENLETFQQLLDAFNRRDREAWLVLCDPEAENVPPRDWPESAPIRGREAVWDFFVEGQEPWDQPHFGVGELFDAGNDKVVAEQIAEVQGKASGAGVAWSYWHVMTFRDGRAFRSEWFTDRADALAAAGVPE